MFCRLVKAADNPLYQAEFDLMKKYAPGMLSRKIYSSLHQSAQVLHHVLANAKPSDILVSAGAFEDMPTEVLDNMGYKIIKVDPVLNMDLHTFASKTEVGTIDLVLSTSVIEHVPDDVEFIEDICKLLKPGGLCIMTCDFKPGYKQGDPLPATCERLYTKERLQLLKKTLTKHKCKLTEKPLWDIKDTELDFTWDNVDYCFVGISFKKEK